MPNFTWPSLGLSAFGGGTSSARTDAADRVPDANCTTHSDRLWHRPKDSRTGRDSDGFRPSSRSGMLTEDERDEEDDGRVPRAAERRKVRSGRERVDVSSLGVMYCIDDEPVGIVVFCVW